MVAATLLRPAVACTQSAPAGLGPVRDDAHVMSSAARRQLVTLLSAYRTQSGHQLAFLSVPSLKGDTPEAYALRAADAWGLGRGRDEDGLLMLVARQERAIRIEVGRGLEGSIPDAVASRIVREVIAPTFKLGQYAWGIRAGFRELMVFASELSANRDSQLASLSGITGPVLPGLVNDHARVMDVATEQRIQQAVTAVASSTGVQLAVLTARCESPGVDAEHCVAALRTFWESADGHMVDALVCWLDTATSSPAQPVVLTYSRVGAVSMGSPRPAPVSEISSQLLRSLHDVARGAGIAWPGEVAQEARSAALPPNAGRILKEWEGWMLLIAALTPFLVIYGLLRARHPGSSFVTISFDGERSSASSLTSASGSSEATPEASSGDRSGFAGGGATSNW